MGFLAFYVETAAFNFAILNRLRSVNIKPVTWFVIYIRYSRYKSTFGYVFGEFGREPSTRNCTSTAKLLTQTHTVNNWTILGAFAQKRPVLLNNKEFMFHQDNESSHTSIDAPKAFLLLCILLIERIWYQVITVRFCLLRMILQVKSSSQEKLLKIDRLSFLSIWTGVSMRVSLWNYRAYLN